MRHKYGNGPEIVASVQLYPSEICYCQYLPIFMFGNLRIPRNFEWIKPLYNLIEHTQDDYVYITAKHMWVTEDSANREGWHIDGFMTEDVNYIWYDTHPTQFCEMPFNLIENHEQSIEQMSWQALPSMFKEYPVNTLLRLDNSVVHRVNPKPFNGLRTFVKISVSRDRYNLQGNSHNYLFDYCWDMKSRKKTRNHPVGG